MTTQELYDLMAKGFDDIKATLTSIDNRLRNVETDVAELKKKKRFTTASMICMTLKKNQILVKSRCDKPFHYSV